MLARNKFILAPNLVSGMRDNAKKLFEALILWSGHKTEEYTADNFICTHALPLNYIDRSIFLKNALAAVFSLCACIISRPP